MFSGKIEVCRLTEKQVTDRAVEDLNALLKFQHSEAEPVTREIILQKMREMTSVAAWSDDRLVGLGVIRLQGGYNFAAAEIYHLVIEKNHDIRAIGARIAQMLLQEPYVPTLHYIDIGSWVQDPILKEVFIALGFKEKPGTRFRLRLRS